jgi:hypothetical protein
MRRSAAWRGPSLDFLVADRGGHGIRRSHRPSRLGLLGVRCVDRRDGRDHRLRHWKARAAGGRLDAAQSLRERFSREVAGGLDRALGLRWNQVRGEVELHAPARRGFGAVHLDAAEEAGVAQIPLEDVDQHLAEVAVP